MARNQKEFTGEYWEVAPLPTRKEKIKIQGYLRSSVERVRKKRKYPSVLELYEKELEKKNN